MHGNVVEWCNDWYAKYPKEEVKDPQGPIKGSSKILRGGSFSFLFTTVVRAADRFHFTPAYESYSAGLRLVREN
jgi:formylglycine-generating enzyme required for sulfatase activity